MEEKRKRGRSISYEREQVLRQSMRLFWRSGFKAVSTRQIEHATGLSSTSIYHAFGNKQALYRQALELYVEEASHFLFAPLIEGNQGLDDTLAFGHRLLGEMLAQAEPMGCMVCNCQVEQAAANPEIQALCHEFDKRRYAAVRASLQRAADAGELRSDQIDPLCDSFCLMILGLINRFRAGASADALRTAHQSIVISVQLWRTTAGLSESVNASADPGKP